MYAGIPLSDARVDVVVCDLPFGRKFGTRVDMAAKLPLILTEMERFVSLHYKKVLLCNALFAICANCFQYYHLFCLMLSL